MTLVQPKTLRPLIGLVCGISFVASAGEPSVQTQVDTVAKKTESTEVLPLCTAGLAKGQADAGALGLYDVGGGKLAADYADSVAAANCVKTTSANLSFKIDDVELNLSGPLNYRAPASGSRRVQTDTNEPALCESYLADTGHYTLELRNANNDIQGAQGLLPGVASLRYQLGPNAQSKGAFVPQLIQATYGPWLRCFDATVANATLPAAASDKVFNASFEKASNLQVEYLDTSGARITSDQMVTTIGSDSVYKVRVTNLGEAAATNVRIREFLPKSTGPLTPNMTGESCINDATAQPCNAVDGSLAQNVASIAPGASVTYTLTRKVAGSSPIAPEVGALTSVAAFVNPDEVAELNPADNSRRLRIGLVANGIPTADPKSINTQEDTGVAVTLSGTDPDQGDTLVAWPIATQPLHGTLSGTAPNLTYTPAADYNGPDSFTYRATDNRGGTSVPATVSITVGAVNDAPRVATLTNRTYAEGASVVINLWSQVTDPESNAFTVTVTGLPSGVTHTFSYDDQVNLISGSPSNTAAAGSPYTVTVTATDPAIPSLTTSQQFTFTVNNTNQVPTVASPIADQSTAEGASGALNVAGNFADGDTGDVLTFSVTAGALPSGLTLASNGQISGTISQTAATGSPYSVTITANDGSGTVSDTFSWTVSAVNVNPVVGTLSDRLGVENEPLEILGSDLRAAFSDPDDPTAPFNDTLTFTVSGLPAGLNYFPGSSNISGVPAFGTDGNHIITVTATDPGTLTASQTFTLTIANTNRAPTVANTIANQSATVATAFNFQFADNTFADLDTSDTLSYTAQLAGGGVLPTWLAFDGPTRTFSGTPSAGDTGTVSIDVIADDGHGGTVVDTFDITVNPS